jgi:hypothetical protein
MFLFISAKFFCESMKQGGDTFNNISQILVKILGSLVVENSDKKSGIMFEIKRLFLNGL